MKDFYLKFTSREHAVKVLSELGFSHEDGLHHEKAALDEVGLIYKPNGETSLDDDGNEVFMMDATYGWHVNIRTWCDDLAELLGKRQEVITPKTPSRVWA